MFLRAASIVSLVLVALLTLYLPSAHPPERFVQQVRTEHALNREFWGPQRALRTLARALDLYEGTKDTQPLGQGVPHPAPASALEAAMVTQLAQATQAFTHNAYFRSIDALLMLACFRLAALLEWLAPLSVFILVAVFDGAARRVVKAKTFGEHNPEIVAVHAVVLVLVLCASLVALVLPVTVHPAWLALAPIAVGVCLSFAVANYHRRMG